MTAPLDQFVQLANAQNDAYPRGKELPWTAARQRDFLGLSMFLEGRDNQMFFDAGTAIRTPFDGAISSTEFGPKRPTDDHRRPGGGTIAFMETPWTEYEWGQQISWHEVNLQGGDPLSAVNSQQFWNLLEKRNKDFTLDPLKKMEDALFATPTSTMFDDAGTGLSPIKSIFTHCNEWEDRHYVTDQGATAGEIVFENRYPGSDGAPLSTTQGLLPADYEREDAFGTEFVYPGGTGISSQLAPTKVYYDTSELGANTTGADHILEQMAYLMDQLSWDAIPLAGEWAEGQEVRPRMICCSPRGKKDFLRTNRAHGELFAVISPIGDPSQANAQYGGIPLYASDSLAKAAVYPEGAIASASQRAGVTEYNAAAAGPRFYFFDPRCVNIWFHTNRRWTNGDWYTMKPVNEDIMVRRGMFLGNMHFESFVQNGILIPGL